MLTPEEKQTLVRIVRNTILAEAESRPLPALPETPKSLWAPGAAFVTLHKHGNLRGCVGHIKAFKPLIKSIQEMAIAAAFDDSRFSPLQREEIPELSIEISVLSPLKKIESIDEIVVGTHGLYLQKGFQSGLLLPQVPTELGWTKEQFLSGICQKAGLPNTAWKSANLFIFTAEIFS
jgi:AmmeMemoRadiSam system protein A